MIVTRHNFWDVVFSIGREKVRSVDTETTGLNSFKDDELFSIIVGTATDSHYFNFIPYEGLSEEFVLPRSFIAELGKFFQESSDLTFMQNAKFDLHMLAKDGMIINTKIHDTEVMGRLLYNKHGSYSLSEQAKRIGKEKLTIVEDYIEQHKLYESTEEGKKPCYNKVPFPIISEYGMVDGRVTYDLGIHQLKELGESPPDIYYIEQRFTHTLYNIEKKGMKINYDYCKEALAFEKDRAEKIKEAFRREVGQELIDSAKSLGPILISAGDSLGRTNEGRDSISDWVLEDCKSPIAQMVREHRDASKRASTYWGNLINFSDSRGFIHSDYRQAGTVTGRLSCRTPNFQNVTRRDESTYPIRKGIVADEGFVLVEFDYKAQEFRLTVEYAGETELADKIMAGFDPHQATADMVKIDRDPAKTLNFALIYGVGKAKLARMLGIAEDEAATLKAKYFYNLPGVKRFIYKASDTAKARGYVLTWSGRRLHFPDPNDAYKAANGIIQGGCADITKNAGNMIHEYLLPYKSHIIAQIHDSYLLQIHKTELDLIDGICDRMRKAYPFKILPMDVDMKWSETTWHDMQKGDPRYAARS